MHEFTVGITEGASPTGIVTGPDGNLWFTESGSGIGRITPSGAVTELRNGITPGNDLTGITVGSDGNLWFIESNTENLGRPAIGRITP